MLDQIAKSLATPRMLRLLLELGRIRCRALGQRPGHDPDAVDDRWRRELVERFLDPVDHRDAGVPQQPVDDHPVGRDVDAEVGERTPDRAAEITREASRSARRACVGQAQQIRRYLHIKFVLADIDQQGNGLRVED
jgi:hypothetical protein